MIVLPKTGGYWVDPPQEHPLAGGAGARDAEAAHLKATELQTKFEMDDTARCYR